MKSILSTIFFLAFSIGVGSFNDMVFSDKTSSRFFCFEPEMVASCTKEIEKFSSSSIYYETMEISQPGLFVVFTNQEYAKCVDFTNKILSISSCKTCTVNRQVGNLDLEFCHVNRLQHFSDAPARSLSSQLVKAKLSIVDKLTSNTYR